MTSRSSVQLLVLTPDTTLLHADNVHRVKIQLADGGGIGIWPGHAPLLAESVAAPLRYADDLGEHLVQLSAGVLLVVPDRVTVYTTGPADREVIAGGPTGVGAAKRFARLTEAVRARQQTAVDGGAQGEHVKKERA